MSRLLIRDLAQVATPAGREAPLRAGALGEIDVLELSEAFAAVVLSCLARLPIPPDVVNPDGGAIAIGHPLGASAARTVVDCARGLRRRGGGFGIAAACIGVGQGIAVGIEVPA